MTTRKGGKLSKNWNGPYVVENVLGKGTYRLSGLKHAINGNRLKLYVTRYVPPSQTTEDIETEKKHDKDKDDTPEKNVRTLKMTKKRTLMDPSLKQRKALGREKNVTKTNMPALKKDASALKMMKKTL